MWISGSLVEDPKVLELQFTLWTLGGCCVNVASVMFYELSCCWTIEGIFVEDSLNLSSAQVTWRQAVCPETDNGRQSTQPLPLQSHNERYCPVVLFGSRTLCVVHVCVPVCVCRHFFPAFFRAHKQKYTMAAVLWPAVSIVAAASHTQTWWQWTGRPVQYLPCAWLHIVHVYMCGAEASGPPVKDSIRQTRSSSKTLQQQQKHHLRHSNTFKMFKLFLDSFWNWMILVLVTSSWFRVPVFWKLFGLSINQSINHFLLLQH